MRYGGAGLLSTEAVVYSSPATVYSCTVLYSTDTLVTAVWCAVDRDRVSQPGL